MNENIDLTKILKDCPKGTEFWSDNFGVVKFLNIGTEWDTPIEVELNNGWTTTHYTKEGWCDRRFPANCLLWPSKDCRDWSKFTASWCKKDTKEKFDPKTLKPFDKVLVRNFSTSDWRCGIFSHHQFHQSVVFNDTYDTYKLCIPYNDNTKHLVGTTDEAPEYYRYWEE